MPLLSICIPTYNRSKYLEDSLNTIVKQKCFIETDLVEIVICDNFSSDNTQEIGEKYAKIYEGKVRYFRNSENIRDANFEKVLSYGQGDYLKLNNDTLNHQDGSLEKMIETLNATKSAKNVLFFGNAELKISPIYKCNCLDEFVQKASFITTWIGSFGIWRSDFISMNDFGRSSKLQLIQTDILLRQISTKGDVYIDNRPLFISIQPKTRGGFNLYEVFIKNYLGILNQYVKSGEISKWSIFKEKKKLMKRFILPNTLNIIFKKKENTYLTNGAKEIIIKHFGTHPYFYVALFRFSRKYIFKVIGNSFKIIFGGFKSKK